MGMTQHAQSNNQRRAKNNIFEIMSSNQQEQQQQQQQQQQQEQQEQQAANETKAPDYYDQLRVIRNVQHKVDADSAVMQILDYRIANLASIMPYSEIDADGNRTLSDFFVYLEAAGFLALQHFNERSGKVLSHLPERLGDCNVYLTIDMLDTLFSPVHACSQLYSAAVQDVTVDKPKPVAIAGAARSAVSQPLSILTGAYDIPQVNAASTSAAMDDKTVSPTFVRTVPTNQLDAVATVQYFANLGADRFGIMYIRDSYGDSFLSDLLGAADATGLKVIWSAYEDGDKEGIINAIADLKQSGLRYFFGVFSFAPATIKFIVDEAFNAGIIGHPNYFWLLSESSISLSEQGFYNRNFDVTKEDDRRVANAISGSGLVLLDIATDENFDGAMRDIGKDQELYDFYVSKHDVPSVFDGFDFDPTPSLYQYLNYDAVMALGIAMCDAHQEFITGPELVDQIKATEFHGVSGPIAFDPVTGTRSAASINFRIVNLVVEANETDLVFEARTSARINTTANVVEHLRPFVYSGGDTSAPLHLPPPAQNMNLIGTAVKIIGWSQAGLVLFLSVAFACWTYYYRNKNIIRAAQPFFLAMICVGTFLMGCSIIPLGFEEPMSSEILDLGCMAAPWLFITGFGVAFSGLLCKLWRIYKVFYNSMSLTRAKVGIRAVVAPFFVITFLNEAVLIAWTLVAPLKRTRIDVRNIDQFGRSIESYGTCSAGGGKASDLTTAFIVVLFAINFLSVVFANYQSYLTRHMPSDFNETYYLSLSMASLLEGFLIGVPILFLVADNPTADFMVRSVLVTFMCIAILFPIFVTKMLIRRKSKMNQAHWSKVWGSFIQDNSQRGRHAHTRTSMAPTTNTVAEIRRRAAEANSGAASIRSSERYPSGDGKKRVSIVLTDADSTGSLRRSRGSYGNGSVV